MKFSHVQMLFLIWAVPGVFFICLYGMNRRRSILSTFCSAENLKTMAPGMSGRRRWVKYGWLMLALLLMTVAMAGPEYGYKWQMIERKGVDIYVAIDCSKSMMATDINPTRLERAKREVFDLLNMLEGDRVGLVAFAGTAFVQCPLTLDYQAFNLFMSVLGPDYIPVGGTNIGEAIRAALGGFSEKENSDKAVILITDGESTGSDPIAAAEEARKKGVKIFCIGVGNTDGTPVPGGDGGFVKDDQGKIVLARLDEATLKKIAEITGGAYVRSVAGDMDLDVIYKQGIRGTMDQKTLSSGKKKVWEDRYQWVLGPAILCLIIYILLPAAVIQRGKEGA